MQLLQSLDSASAASHALRRIDHLPGLIMLLLPAVAGFGEIENDGDQNGENPEIFEHFEKGPVGQIVGRPLARPLYCVERQQPPRPARSSMLFPAMGTPP